MKKITCLIIIILFLLITGHVSAADDVHLIIKYKNDVTTQSVGDPSLNLRIVEVDKNEVKEKIKIIKKNKDVAYVEVDQKAYLHNSFINDPYFSTQSDVFNAINIKDEWSSFSDKNKDLIVAVVDTGIDLDHPDLKNQIILGRNILNPLIPPEDHQGHGTHIAGIIGATTNNKVGIASLPRNVKIMPIKVFEEETGNMSTVILGILYAVDHGADIINLSLGSVNGMKALEDAINYAQSKGVLVVAASGNDNEHFVTYPAKYESVLAVGATDTVTGGKAWFSNYGEEMDLSAPGTNIFSTLPGGKYGYESGTSMSAAIVSSTAAMLWKQYPFLTVSQLKNILFDSSSKSPLPYDSNQLLGNGQIDAGNANSFVNNHNRTYGYTAYDTANAISKLGWPILSEASLKVQEAEYTGKFTILASGELFPDSLAAAPLSSYLGSPILLAEQDKIFNSTLDELKRLGTTHVLIVGGPVAISPSIEKKLTDSGYNVIRIAGKDRYETAIKINRLLPVNNDEAFVVSGENFPDALSISAIAGIKKAPIIYTKSDRVPESVKEFIQNNSVEKMTVVGGKKVIEENIEEYLESFASIRRVAGINRYETSLEVLKEFPQQAEQIFFATGKRFPDALSGAALAAHNNQPLVLVNPSTITETTKYVLNVANNNGVKNYKILGGPGAIELQIAWEINKYIK
ncbi:cell wall-binding repeat-containing protein [Alkalihalobacillus sp. AL-G]|uniref:S8 family serine peptidase n=1 Tax=Alkalihalobacillus sp. AL-G TaxID=2926399 RepID=UPI0027297633|nr:cell wall-binding repeat-containing protein [Alkalihalobacillus sp. AL-G]WLD92996.1 S8 family serine peptidase [Alkalihalobacillus sp. AL-G]